MPNSLLFELVHLTRLQFDAMCHDLSDPWLSHAAPTHLRPVLQGLGHVAFTLGHETDQPVARPRSERPVSRSHGCARSARP